MYWTPSEYYIMINIENNKTTIFPPSFKKKTLNHYFCDYKSSVALTPLFSPLCSKLHWSMCDFYQTNDSFLSNNNNNKASLNKLNISTTLTHIHKLDVLFTFQYLVVMTILSIKRKKKRWQKWHSYKNVSVLLCFNYFKLKTS